MTGPGDPENARRINTALILDQLRQDDLISRAQIARRLRLSRMTVSAVVTDLIEKEFVAESGQGDSSETGGRKPILLTLNPRSKYVLGIDVGTTNTVVALGNLRGQLILRRRIPTSRNHSLEKVMQGVKDLTEETIASASVERTSILGIGLSVAGLVDNDSGKIVFSPDLDWRNVDVKSLLHEQTGFPVVVDNCTRAMAFGERWFGKAKSVRNLFYVNIGYGIGSAIAIEGKNYNYNSEFGHLLITKREVKCDCGNYGCLEAVSSGHAIERTANERLASNAEEWITAQNLAQMARDGNEDAVEIFRDAGKYLGRAVSYAANMFNPDMIILGGGVALAGDHLLRPLIEEYHRHVMAIIKDTTSIEISSLGIDAGVIGAVALALNSFVFKAEQIAHLFKHLPTKKGA